MVTVTLDDFAPLLAKGNVTQKKTFGMPSLFVNGNMFLSITADGVAYKLGEAELAEALRAEGAKTMPLKGWVEIPFAAAIDWLGWAERSLTQVARLPPKEKKQAKR